MYIARRSNQSFLKEINPDYSLEGLMLKLKLQYFGHLMWKANLLEKTLMLGKIEGRRRGWQRMRWLDGHPWLNAHESEQTPGDSEGQGMCCIFRDQKVRNALATEQQLVKAPIEINTRDFLGGPMAKTVHLTQGPWVQSLLWKLDHTQLRVHMRLHAAMKAKDHTCHN